MKNSIISNIQKLHPFDWMLESLKNGEIINGLNISRACRTPIIVSLAKELKIPTLILTDRDDHARNIYEELNFWLEDDKPKIFTEPTPLFYENAEWGYETRINRIQVLSDLAKYHIPFLKDPEIPPIVISSIKSAMTRTVSRREFLKATRIFRTGDTYEITQLVSQLFKYGYKVVDTVTEKGQIANRGGILDIWVPIDNNPSRLDFFGNEIENIRRFNPGSQRSLGSIVELLVTPAREFLFDTNIGSNKLKDNEPNEFLIPYLHPYSSTLINYLPKKSLIIFYDKDSIILQCNEIEEGAIKLREESITDNLIDDKYPIPYKSWSELEEEFLDHLNVNLGSNIYPDSLEELETEYSTSFSSYFRSEDRFAGRLISFANHIIKLTKNNNQVLIISKQTQRLQELIKEKNLDEKVSNIQFFDNSLSEGFIFEPVRGNIYHLITDSEIFGWEKPNSRKQISSIFEPPESKYSDLAPGELVVHVDYGIGLFEGLVERELDGASKEFLCVRYKDGDQVFVPIHQADRLTPYIGSSGKTPALGNLGTQEWIETKKRVNGSVQDIAEELLDLYARRQAAKGFAFQKDTQWQKELESSFPYIETNDQLKVLQEVKNDMELDRPMDRLLCGDVGYGKTEIALRAAFKAVTSGKQVAVLVPTTVLAQQHFDTFAQRLSPFPVTVEMLSRFRTQKEQDEILSKLNRGKIDIIVGTHRLIQKDVIFKDLGLLIIDEEQRFGVTHKEYIKKLRSEIDVLTLTATPIPRTLYMALTGIRDISQINTPPDERMPVVTHIGPYSQRIVKQAICRELERGGQIFFVHNRVQTIHAMKSHLNNLVPEARVGIGHGQMPEQQLSHVMREFTNGKIDILLCTSIIESGLDIPNANTLIVDRGDTFGLAQLYQLRGRVGRGTKRAYAYFFKHRKKIPTIDGQERLEIIAENTQLGSGYSIAMRDLEMRGAGELLGSRQHGYIAAIGFHLYTRLLASAVKRTRKSIGMTMSIDEDTLFKELSLPINVELPLDTSIPASYIEDKNLRLKLYRRIATINNESELENLEEEFEDRFGAIPKPVKNLFFLIKLKMLSRKAGITAISFDNRQLIVKFPEEDKNSFTTNFDEDKTLRFPEIKGAGIRTGKNAYWLLMDDENQWQEKTIELLKSLENSIN